jgi:hypothetical protein
MLPWRDLCAAVGLSCRRAGPPPKSGARAGGRRLSGLTQNL